ncbi:TonB-dependent siderophore receptor [Xylophilus rhododendri]|uniref:TonB-dependent siderophore receptor n=1 Tax=Xylophilus rhododendri TaxID=2697032 RepID=A0A857JB72_9BURK|nr:TonB-dependent siderophore receptor [Xylophilus rhododendri]QHJ00310.1 TonB-dependent siderophore receptor [Xylophilus rhododendri]
MFTFRRPPLPLFALSPLVLACAVHAQAPAARLHLDLPAASLDRSLSAVARQAGVQVLFASSLTEGHRAPALRGEFTAREALDKVLAGSGLVLRSRGAGTWTVERDTTIKGALSEVRVTADADRESAFGPAGGIVARRGSSATRTDSALLETPQSVSVITREQIEAQQPGNLEAALRYTPGITSFTDGAQSSSDVYAMRGFAQTVGSLLRDGMRMQMSDYYGWEAAEIYGLERVEVIRGAASVLYGQTQPGGMVNLVTKRPTATPHHEVELQAGSFGRKQIAFDIGGPLGGSGDWSYRLVGLDRDAETQVDYTVDRRRYLAPSLSWKPDGVTSLTLLAEYQRQTGDYTRPVPTAGTVLPAAQTIPVSRFVGEPGFDRMSNERYGAGWMFEHAFSGQLKLRQNARYTHFEHEGQRLTVSSFNAATGLATRSAQARRGSGKLFTADSSLEARFDTGAFSHVALAGIDWFRGEYDQSILNGTAPSLNLYNPVYGAAVATPTAGSRYTQQQTQVGAYLQDQIRHGQWAAVLGLRHDWVRTENATNAVADPIQKPTATTGRAGLVYLADNGLAPYISYSESFLPVAGTDIAGQQFAPETGKQWEAGVKYQPAGFDSFITAALFDLRRQNVTTPNPNDTNYSVQEGEVRSRGLELEAKAQLDRGLALLASYTRTDIEVTRANPASNGSTQQGKVPARAARDSAAAWADYTVQQGALAGLGMSLGLRHVGPSWGDALNTFQVPGYTTTDLALRYDLGRLDGRLSGTTIALNVYNLTDKQYVASCFNNTVGCQFGGRRNAVATLRYRW